MSENIQSIANGSFVLGQTSANDSSLLVNENSGNVSILQGTVVTSAGIVGDGTTQNPLRADETELYYNPTNGDVGTNAEFVMSESIWNFEKVMITFDNMEYANRYVTMIIDLSGLPHDNNRLSTPWCNGGVPGEVNIPWAIFKINTTGNIKYVDRGLIYGTWSSPSYTTGASRGLRVVRVVGINRIANNQAGL